MELAPARQVFRSGIRFRFSKFCLLESILNTSQISCNSFGHCAAVSQPVFGLDSQHVFRQVDQLPLNAARIQSGETVFQLSSACLTEYVRSISTHVRRFASENLTQNRPQTEHVGAFIQSVDFA